MKNILIRIFYTILLFSISCTNVSEDNIKIENTMTTIWGYEYFMEGLGSFADPVLVGDSLIIMIGDGNTSVIRIDDGSLKWKQSTPNNHLSIRNILFDDNQVYGWQYKILGEKKYRLYALSLETGQENWSLDSVAYLFKHGLSSDYYYCRNVHVLNKISKSGNIIDTKISEYKPDVLASFDGKVYSGQGWPCGAEACGRIIVYDENTFDSLWVYNTDGGGFTLCYPYYESGYIYSGSIWGIEPVVVALDANSGEILWETKTSGCFQIISGENVLICRSRTTVYSLDKNTGELLWITILPTSDETGSFTYWEGYIYKAHGGGLYIIDVITGEIVHSMQGQDKSYIHKVASGAGKIFIQSSKHLYAFDPYEQKNY